jgi:DNA-binding CsgD family transcriptional regulator/tetratricopeptide (TPR) repeat protein
MRRLRERRTAENTQRKALLEFEAAGDFARARYSYPEALSRYEEALRSPILRTGDARRLSEKYANALFYGHAPEKAREWFERALSAYRSAGITAENADAAGTLLLRLSRQYWLNAATVSALPLISEAIQLGTISKNEGFFARTNLAMAHYLILLGRHEAAAPFFERAGEVRDEDSPEMRAVSLDQRAILYAAQGEKARTYGSFEAAAEAAKALPDGYQVTSIWDDYGIWAMALGDVATAQLCRERALFVARERHIAWRIPYLSLRYADLLSELEEYERARNLLLDSLTYDCETPCIKILVALIGTRLASALDDDALLHRCLDERAIEYAFASEEPARIGPLVSAVVRNYAIRGETKRATALMQRGLATLLSADHACDLLVDAATFGTSDAQKSARRLLRSRASLACGEVAAAYLDLFDAALAKRRKNAAAQRTSARRAAAKFARIGWLAQEKFALSLADDVQTKPSSRSAERSFRTMLGDPSSLTKREAEVADLALKGYTNRAIARELSVSEHTVESHMTSIMNRLGIRSRHQLTNVVVDSGRAPQGITR